MEEKLMEEKLMEEKPMEEKTSRTGVQYLTHNQEEVG